MTFDDIEQQWRQCSTRRLRLYLWEQLTGTPTRGWFAACQDAVRRGDHKALQAWRNADNPIKQEILQLGSRFGNEAATEMMGVHLACALAAIAHQPWTSGTLPLNGLAAISSQFQHPPPDGFLRDLIAELGGFGFRLPRQTIQIPVLLVDTQEDEGVVANLTLDLMPDGEGQLYPIPKLAFVHRDAEFLKAEADAKACVQQMGLWQDGYDIRWGLERRDGKPLSAELIGNSVGGALAVALAKLLAIELAAARVRGMTPQQILAHLSKQFEMLATDYVDIPQRQRTLRGAIDWSYGLLTPDEQQFFSQLSVFSGGLFVEAAQKICDVPEALITNLHVKSLLVAEKVMEHTRYRLLEPLRAYAAEKLGESVELRKAHAAYFLTRAQNYNQQFNGSEQSTALSLMEVELNNLRAAMDFAQGQEERRLLGELGVVLGRFFNICDLWSEGISRLKQAEKALRSLTDNELLTQLLGELGRFYSRQGDYETARQIYAENLQIQKELRDKQGLARSLQGLGTIAWYQGKFEEAKQLYTESLQMAKELQYKQVIANSLNGLGIIEVSQGAYEEAKRLFTESQQIHKELGDKRSIATTLNNLGRMASYQGVYEEAKNLFTQSLQMIKELGNKPATAFSFHHFGMLAKAEGDSARAALFLLHAIRLYEEMETVNSKDVVGIREELAVIQDELGAEPFEKLKREAEAMSLEQVIELALAQGAVQKN